MADTVALVSIVAGSAVAITVPLITAQLEKRRLAWQRQEQHLDELRSLLDDSMLRFHETFVSLDGMREALALRGRASESFGAARAFESFTAARGQLAEVREAAERYEAKFHQIVQDGIRIEVRLGADDSIAAAHRDVNGTLKPFHDVASAILEQRLDSLAFAWPWDDYDRFRGTMQRFGDEVRRLFGSIR
jgi:hypothetical protein